MWRLILLVLLAVVTVGCEAQQRVEPDVTAGPAAEPVIDEPEQSDPIGGYDLLYNLVSKQQRVGGALIIPFKRISDETRGLIKDVAAASQEAAQQLEQFASASPAIQIQDLNLPPIELARREATEKLTTQRLLGAGGDEFELQLLLSQVEATDLGATLAQQIAEIETDPQRQSWLRDFAERYRALYNRAVDRLAVE